MDSKTLIKALKIAVREVIKEELTDILREGLQSTITEMKRPSKPNVQTAQKTAPAVKRKSNVQFTESKWADILNETDPLVEQISGSGLNSFKDIMQEGMDEIRMTSADAQNFGMMRNNMKAALGLAPEVPAVMEDPEDGKVYEVAPEVQQALTRDYSALMKAINKKKQ